MPGRATAPSLLVAASAAALAQSVAGPAGALLAARVGGDGASGLPQAAIVVGSALTALGWSRGSTRFGAGVALGVGALVGSAGSVLVVLGGLVSSLVAIVAGSLCFGAGNAVVLLSRYAAAAGVPAAERPRAISRLLVATTVGAVAGPNLLEPTSALGEATGLPPLTGCYAVGALVLVLAAPVFTASGRPTPPPAPPASTSPPPAGSRSTVAGIGVLSLANLVMVGVMTGGPVHLAHLDVPLEAIGLIVSLHIAAMYGPSPLSSRLVERFGPAVTAGIGGVVLLVATVVAATAGGSVVGTATGLTLLGAGWNVALLAGSSMLAGDAPEPERSRREGWGEVGMGFAAAGGGAGSGVMLASGGFPGLALIGAGGAAVLLLWTARTVTARMRT